MPEKLLERITRGGPVSLSEMDVSLPLLEVMLAGLVRAGYLRQMEPCSPAACTRCGEQASCDTPQASGQVWARTKRR